MQLLEDEANHSSSITWAGKAKPVVAPRQSTRNDLCKLVASRAPPDVLQNGSICAQPHDQPPSLVAKLRLVTSVDKAAHLPSHLAT